MSDTDPPATATPTPLLQYKPTDEALSPTPSFTSAQNHTSATDATATDVPSTNDTVKAAANLSQLSSSNNSS